METFKDIISSGQLIVVDWFATWCIPCKTMHPILEASKRQFGDAIRIIKLDIDKNEYLAMQYRVMSVPTLMMFKDGNIVWRQSGVLPLTTLANVIRQHL